MIGWKRHRLAAAMKPTGHSAFFSISSAPSGSKLFEEPFILRMVLVYIMVLFGIQVEGSYVLHKSPKYIETRNLVRWRPIKTKRAYRPNRTLATASKCYLAWFWQVRPSKAPIHPSQQEDCWDWTIWDWDWVSEHVEARFTPLCTLRHVPSSFLRFPGRVDEVHGIGHGCAHDRVAMHDERLPPSVHWGWATSRVRFLGGEWPYAIRHQTQLWRDHLNLWAYAIQRHPHHRPSASLRRSGPQQSDEFERSSPQLAQRPRGVVASALWGRRKVARSQIRETSRTQKPLNSGGLPKGGRFSESFWTSWRWKPWDLGLYAAFILLLMEVERFHCLWETLSQAQLRHQPAADKRLPPTWFWRGEVGWRQNQPVSLG